MQVTQYKVQPEPTHLYRNFSAWIKSSSTQFIYLQQNTDYWGNLQKEVKSKQNQPSWKKGAALFKMVSIKSYEIQASGQEMAVMLGWWHKF